jgi:predicted permease
MMGLLRLVRARLHALVHRDVVADEIREELEFHVRMRTEEYERAGAPPAVAASEARRRVGNLAVLQDRGYDIRGGGMMETILQDVRYGIRLLWKQRGFSLVAILTLALGCGLSTALFSVIDAAMLRPLPYPHPEQLVDITIETPQRSGKSFRLGPSFDDIRVMAASPALFSDLAIWRTLPGQVIGDGPEPERLRGLEITEGYLSLHGVTLLLGRGIQADDTYIGAPAVVLLGYDYWQRRFGGSSDVLGKPIRFDEGTATIVGVLPASFYRDTPIWRPLVVTPFLQSLRGAGTTTDGRLRPGLTIERAERELTDILGRQPGAAPGQRVIVRSGLAEAVSGYRTTVNILTWAVALILLIACVNVAGLVLARGATRLPELAVRASIGAGRVRLVRQLLTENLLLSLVGGLAGVLVAWLALDTLVANIPMSLPSNSPATINLRVLALSLTLTLVTGLVFGLLPALRLSRVSVTSVLARGARPAGSPLTRRGSQLLIAAEVSLAVILLAGAGLMVRSFGRLLSVDLGFHPDDIMTMEVVPVDPSAATSNLYYSALLQTIRSLPGVEAAGAIDHLPLKGSSTMTGAKGDGEIFVSVNTRQVLPGYFEAIGLLPRSGRLPSEADRSSGRRVAVVNETAQRMLFHDGAAAGRALVVGKAGTEPLEIIGVVNDVRFRGPSGKIEPEVYLPFNPTGDSRSRGLVVVVRPSGDARGLPDLLRQAAHGVGPRVLLDRIRPGEAWLDDRILTPKRRTVLLGLLGGLGLVLALVGVFGMTAYAVARRTQEIGLRIAFGARPLDVVRTIVGDAAVPVGIGLVAGLGGAALATRIITTFLFNTPATDPVTFAAVAITLGLAAVVAAWIPARRASRLDPVQALRAD